MERATKQKDALSRAARSFKRPFSAEELHEKVPEASLATTYRYLKGQQDLHAYTCNGKTLYAKTQSHCHYTCTATGKTFHFTLDDLGFLKGKVPGSIASIQIEITGTCEECGGEHLC